MAIKISAFACGFRCGERVKTKRNAMEAHEERCFQNPKRRACQTCKHLECDPAEPDVGVAGGFWCQVIGDMGERRYDCPKHLPAPDQDGKQVERGEG